MPSSTEYTQCHRHNKPDLTFYYDVGANSGTVNDKLQFGNSLIQAISGKLTNSSASKKMGNFAFNITRYDNKDSAKDGKAETTGTLTFFFTNKNEQVEGSIIVSQSRQDPIDNNGNVVIAPNKTETLPIIGGTIKYLGKQGHITITTNTTTEREVKVYFDKQYNYKRTPDLTFYFSVDTTLPSTSFARFNIDDPSKSIRNQSQIVNCDLTDKIPTDKNNYKKIGIGVGDHLNMGIPFTSNVDSYIGTMRAVSFIFNSDNNSSSVDSLSIYGAYQVKLNSQGYFMLAENEILVFDIVSGMGKYLGARGIVEIRSLSQFQRRADVYFDK